MEEKNLYETFNTLFNSNKYEEALVLIDKLILINKYNAVYYNKKGLCLHYIGGKLREKLECYNKAVILDNTNTSFITNKASALVELEEYDEADRLLDLSLKLDDQHSFTYFWKGRLFYLKSQYFKSLENFDKCLRLNYNKKYAHYYKGLIFSKINCFQDSIIEFDLEAKLHPSLADNYNQKSLSLMKMKLYDQAISEVDKAIKIEQNNVDFLNNKATYLIQLNKLDDALIEIENCLNQNQYDSNALKNKAQIYLKQRKEEAALKITNKGFKVTSEFYELIGNILRNLNRKDEAIDCLLKAIELKDKTHKSMIDNMGSFLMDNYRNKFLNPELKNIKELNDSCMKLLTEIKKGVTIPFNHQSFQCSNTPLDWKKIQFDQNNILNYQVVHERFICNICLSVVRGPKSCQSCDNIFCSECLTETLKKKDSCPLCRANPFREYKLNLIVKEIYDSITLKCPLECGENFVMENLEKHLSSCRKREKYYECNLCKEKLKLENEITNHREKCPDIMLKCLSCNLNFRNKDSSNHFDICSERTLECDKCLCAIPFKNKESHKVYFCDLLMSVREKAIKIKKNLNNLEILYTF